MIVIFYKKGGRLSADFCYLCGYYAAEWLIIMKVIKEIKEKLKKYKIYSAIRMLKRYNREVFYVSHYPVTDGLNKIKNRDKKIIISLTSYQPRFSTLPLCLRSLLWQKVKPDKIIVWLACSPNEITPEMKQYEKYGIEYRFVNEDLKPHKKYYYALQEYTNDIVITVDDDIIYPRDLVSSLMKTHYKHPNSVCGRRVQRLLFDDNNNVLPYNAWDWNYKKWTKPSYRLLATGCSGILYPPNCLLCEAFNQEMIKKECLYDDDIWLYFMEILNGTNIVWAKNRRVLLSNIRGSEKTALCLTNVVENRTDCHIRNMERIFGRIYDIIMQKEKE